MLGQPNNLVRRLVMPAWQTNQTSAGCLAQRDPGPAPHRAHSRDEYVDAVRLRQKIVRAPIERFYLVLIGLARRNDDDRDVPAASDSPADFQPCRYIHIEKNQIHRTRTKHLDSFIPIRRADQVRSPRCHRGTQRFPVLRAIVNE